MTTRVEPAESSATAPERPERPFAWARWLGTVLILGALLGAAGTVDAPFSRLLGLPATLWGIAGRMFLPPDWSYFGRAAEGMLESIHIAWIGTLIGAALSFPLSFLAAANVSGKASVGIVRQVLNALRAIPELLFAILAIPIVGLGPVAGALGLGISSTGTLGKLSSEAIEGIDTGPVEAVRAVGGGRLQVLRWGVIPQVLPEVVAFWLYRFEINIRAAAILGIVGAGGVGRILSDNISYRRWDRVGMTIIVIVVATIAIDTISGRIRRRIIGGASTRRADKTIMDMEATARPLQ